MPSIVNASATLRVLNGERRSVCSVSGVNPNMAAGDAVGFIEGLTMMYNRGDLTARIHAVSDIVIDD